jgi:hypothetical protein
VELAKRVDREPRRNLARLRAAHAVGDGEERRLEDVGVLVAAPPAARVRDPACLAQSHCSNFNSVSPI